MKRYSQKFVFDRKKPLKTALLAIAFGVDLLNITFLIWALSGSYIYFAALAAGIIVMLAIRIPTVSMTYEIVYEFDGKFRVYKKYVGKTKTVLCIENGNFDIYDNAHIDADSVKLFDDACEVKSYVIEYCGKRYEIAPDDYMLALILSTYDKELK